VFDTLTHISPAEVLLCMFQTTQDTASEQSLLLCTITPFAKAKFSVSGTSKSYTFIGVSNLTRFTSNVL
jgi:hypothetical protein